MRGALKEAEEGRQKDEVEAAGLRVEVELTSTLSATYSAHQGVGPLGVHSQGSGSTAAAGPWDIANRCTAAGWLNSEPSGPH